MTGARDGAGRTVLITGASAGIGAALARMFAKNGFDLVLTARRAGRLEALKDELERGHAIQVRALPADLARPEAPEEIAETLRREGVHVDGLVNNAGYNIAGLSHEVPWRAKRDLLQVMTIAPYELTHLFLPGMQARNYGRILNVASVVGLLPGPVGGTLYSGVKWMLVGFSESLHADEKGSGVHVTALCPGFTHSEFHDVDGSRAQLRRLPSFMWLTAERVAEAGYAAVMRNEVRCVPGAFYKLLCSGVRLMPRRLSHALASRAGRKRKKWKQDG